MRDDSDIYAQVGRKLKQLRSEKGFTQAQIAQIIDVSAQQYQKYEDARNKCSLNNLAILADYYGTSLTELLEGERPAEPRPAPAPARRPADQSRQLTKDADLVARLVSAYVRLPSGGEQRRIVELLEAIVETHTRERA
jgi:transcriptional regulator with XRE-family HTH domain